VKKENIKLVIIIALLVGITETFFVFKRQDELPESELIAMPDVDYWQTFAKIKKERRYIEEAGAHYRIPVFTPEVLDLSGQEIVLSGFFLPYSKIDTMIIVSRYPNASCFYCGLAGIESVAMVEVPNSKHGFLMDQRVLVKGRLSLNNTDVDKLAFVIEDAVVEEL